MYNYIPYSVECGNCLNALKSSVLPHMSICMCVNCSMVMAAIEMLLIILIYTNVLYIYLTFYCLGTAEFQCQCSGGYGKHNTAPQ